jgi:hypothetical protein
MKIWELIACNMWKDNKWNADEINKLLNDGWEPFSSTANVTGGGGGSFLGGVVDINSQLIILFRR